MSLFYLRLRRGDVPASPKICVTLADAACLTSRALLNQGGHENSQNRPDPHVVSSPPVRYGPIHQTGTVRSVATLSRDANAITGEATIATMRGRATRAEKDVIPPHTKTGREPTTRAMP